MYDLFPDITDRLVRELNKEAIRLQTLAEKTRHPRMALKNMQNVISDLKITGGYNMVSEPKRPTVFFWGKFLKSADENT